MGMYADDNAFLSEKTEKSINSPDSRANNLLPEEQKSGSRVTFALKCGMVTLYNIPKECNEDELSDHYRFCL